MSRTSTDVPLLTSRPDVRPFRHAFWLTVGSLFVLCVGFLALGYFQGPKLASAQVDAGAVVVRADQTLRLFTNQPISALTAAQVTIDPAVESTVTNDGDFISVQFSTALDYATEYTVTVDGAVNPSGGASSQLTYSFTTGQPEVYYLDRGVPNDEIVRTSLDSNERTVLFAGERIQEFTAVDELLAITTAAADRTGTLSLVNPETSVTEQVLLPEVGEVADLKGTMTGATLGFTISSEDPGPVASISHTLYTVDLDRGRDVVAVADLDGQPMRVVGWDFIPGSSNIVALTTESTLVRVDRTTGVVLPLGRFFEFDRVSADGKAVVVGDSRGSVAVSLEDGEQQRLQPSLLDGEQPFLGATDVGDDGTLVGKMVLVGEDGTSFSSILAYDDGSNSRVLYQTVNDQGGILDFQVSPNGQYVAVEVQPNSANLDSDEYILNARPASVTTFIVDIATGAATRSVEGFGAIWR